MKRQLKGVVPKYLPKAWQKDSTWTYRETWIWSHHCSNVSLSPGQSIGALELVYENFINFLNRYTFISPGLLSAA